MTFRANVIPTEDVPPETLDTIRLMIGQLPIVMAVRNGGEWRLPISEIDATGQWMLNVSVDQERMDMVFTVTKKQ